jgi:hypothetical protein
MTALIQLDLFEDNDELSLLKRNISDIKKSSDAKGRKQFYMLHEMGKEIISLKEEVYKLRMSMIKREK